MTSQLEAPQDRWTSTIQADEPMLVHGQPWMTLRQKMVGMGCPPRAKMVFGAGNPRARLAVVGEAPGEAEVQEQRPFAGEAGRTLDFVLEAAGLRRDYLWLTYLVKHPLALEGDTTGSSDSVAFFSQWKAVVVAELLLVAPRLVICLGSAVADTLFDADLELQAGSHRWAQTSMGPLVLMTHHPEDLRQMGGSYREVAMAEAVIDFRSARKWLTTAIE